MAEVMVFRDGGYRFVKGVFQYSAGVAAEPGFVLERVRFARLTRLAEGFTAIAEHLKARGLPLTSFCACELRSPAPFTEAGFAEFNRHYRATLDAWGITSGDLNPVARTNVCPVFEPPSTPSFFAFSYVVPAAQAKYGGFIIAGGGEAKEGERNYRDFIIRLGDTSPDAMREKFRYVFAEMERRMTALGFGWADALETRAYTIHDIGSFVEADIVRRGATAGGLTWHFTRPPIVDLECEMDIAAPARQLVL